MHDLTSEHAPRLGERARLGTYGAHGLDELESPLTRALAEELHVGGGRRVARREHGLFVVPLRRLVADAVERAAVREENLLYPRVRPLGDLLHLCERRRSERVELERAGRRADVHTVQRERVKMEVEPQRGAGLRTQPCRPFDGNAVRATYAPTAKGSLHALV
jgi:hypothetical protein